MIAQVPELWDGGWWYAVPSVPDPEEGGQTPGEIPGVGWCAWYNDTHAAMRCPEPVLLPDYGVSPSEIVDMSKPYGRVGGL